NDAARYSKGECTQRYARREHERAKQFGTLFDQGRDDERRRGKNKLGDLIVVHYPFPSEQEHKSGHRGQEPANGAEPRARLFLDLDALVRGYLLDCHISMFVSASVLGP